MNLVPLKVKIGLRANGDADHPKWNDLDGALGDSADNHMFYGWRYDQTSGHRVDTPESPIGFQFGVKLVTPELAAAAVAQWPTLMTVLNETELEDFWDNKVYAGSSGMRINNESLEALRSERELRQATNMFTTAVDDDIAQALDPDNPRLGVVRDRMARWSTAKVTLDVIVVGLP